MNNRRQLEWVQRNRARSDRTRQAGLPIRQLVRGLEVAGLPVAGKLAAVIAEVVDQEFRRHCRITLVEGKTLTVSVDEASMVYAMRIRWLKLLHTVLSAHSGIRRIAFRFGCEGLPLPARAWQVV